ncbi:DUF6076 domain-containing protein [Peribacillus simplex]|uniref:DUF6076 domain-containing protein n=1 Tax=Peribacillus simplex TaxID=1478 RepID=UPI001E5BC268|nr:DUF6076 domain-containing protein [Peribacillus simplex]
MKKKMIYGESNRLYCLSKIAVFEDYEFVGDPYLDGKFTAKGEIKHVYNPLEDVDIISKAVNLIDFNEITPNTIEKLLVFFREFGLLGSVENHSYAEVRYWNSQPHSLEFKEQQFKDIEASLMGLNETFSFAQVNLGKEKERKNTVSDLSLLVNIHNNYVENTPAYIIFDNKKVQTEQTFHTKELVSALIRSRSAFIESIQVLKGEFVPAISFPTLLDVAYFQLINSLYEGKSFNECLNCGLIFLAKHGHQKFCAPLPNRKRSTCENTFNQRQKRLRKRQEKSNNN